MTGPGDGQRTHTGTMPSAIARYGAATAVSAMSNTQLGTYYFSDVSLGASPNRNLQMSGLKQMLADGRAVGDFMDFEDACYCRRQLGLGNGD